MKRLFATFSIAVMLCQVIYAQDSYSINPPIRWQTSNIIYTFDGSITTDYRNAINSAAMAWNNGIEDIHLGSNSSSLSYFTTGDLPYDQVHDLYPLAETDLYKNPDGKGGYYISRCITTITTNTNVMFYSGLADNASAPYCDLISNVVHEFGHWFDLDDNYNEEDSGAAMYFYLDPGQSKKVYNWVRI